MQVGEYEVLKSRFGRGFDDVVIKPLSLRFEALDLA